MNGKLSGVIFKEKTTQKRLVNPFPGLRPFGFEESHLFFGREGQTDEILQKLSDNRFVAVVGASGSGKSSLMFCGLLPILYGGYMAHAGSDWRVFVSRPGMAPIENLAESIFLDGREKSEFPEEDLAIGKTIVSSILESSSLGLVDVVKKHVGSGSQNVLILIDQFEELFRFIRRDKNNDVVNEATAFVNLLLQSINQTDIPVYVALTMRSDFIGESAQFPNLTQLINDSHYLIPQMTRMQMQTAIEGPIAVGGGKISKRLVQQLLNDIGHSADKLPVMQHALMRTWDFWTKNMEEDEILDIRHYHAIGRLTEALSLHADETYNELTTRQKEICEVLFKSLTEKGRDSYGVRRPCSLNVIAQIAGANEEEVIEVVEQFRQPGRSLLMPPPGTPLTSQTIIEVSHESLMWIWGRLRTWVSEEAESAQMYLRLSEAAEMYQVGRTGLWRPPDLQLALNWHKKQNPTFVWAQRYNPYFERAMVFLETSKKAYEDEQKSQALLQKRRLQKARVTSLILGGAAIISIIFFVFAVVKKIEADNQAEIAKKNELEAQENATKAQQAAADANRQRIEAEEAHKLARRNAEIAERNEEEARMHAREARLNQERAEQEAAFAEQQRNLAEQRQTEAEEQRSLAVQNARKAHRLRVLSIAQSMAVKSLQERGDDLKGLLALQAYNFNTENGGEKYDSYIYDGLYYALRQLSNDSSFYRMSAHRDAVRSIDFSGNRIYSVSSDGSILLWDLENYKNSYNVIFRNDFTNRVVKASIDGRWLVNAGLSPDIQLFDLQKPKSKPILIEGHEGFVYDVEFLPNNQFFVSTASDSTLRLNDYANSRLLKKLDTQVKALSISRDGKYLAGASVSGKVYLWNTSDFDNPQIIDMGIPVHAVEFSNNGKKLAVGDESGNLSLFDVNEGKVGSEKIVLTGHASRINDVKFSSDDFFLASAGFDGRVQLWNTSNLNKLPIILRDHNDYVWSLSFDATGNYILAGSKSGRIKIWPTNSDELALQICNELNRNMTQNEWERYVAPDIEYQATCPQIIATTN